MPTKSAHSRCQHCGLKFPGPTLLLICTEAVPGFALHTIPVEDPGFPRRGRGHQPLSLVKKPIIWQDFCRKLHEMKEIKPRRGVPDAPLDPPMDIVKISKRKPHQIENILVRRRCPIAMHNANLKFKHKSKTIHN